MPASPILRIAFFTVAALTLACNVEPQRAPAIGEAYAGPSSLTLYKDIDPKSPAVAIVHHGDLLQITARHRRWYKVRGPKGIEGWTDDTGLLDRDQMNRIRAMSKETAGLPEALLAAHPERALRIPMRPGTVRSINLSAAAAIVTYAALARLGFPGMA